MASAKDEMKMFIEMIAGKIERSEELTSEDLEKINSYSAQLPVCEEEIGEIFNSDAEWDRFWKDSETGIETEEEFKIKMRTVSYKRYLKNFRFLRKIKRRIKKHFC